MKYAVGIDLGGTAVKIGLFSEDGHVLDKTEIRTRVSLGMDTVLDDVASCVMEMTEKHQIALSGITAGLGFPGLLEASGRIDASVDLNVYDYYPGAELSRRLNGIPVAVENDANTAALGEMWQGGGKGYNSLILITLGTGIGSGIVIDKKILRGAHGLAGEIGHIQMNPDEPELCNCGGRGCLDQIASATGIVRYAHRYLEASGEASVLRGMDPLTAKDVIDAARSGDKLARESLTCCMDYLGRMIASVCYVIDPEAVLIGGGVSKAGPYILDLIFEQYKKYPALKKYFPDFALARLGGEAGMYGAAYLAFSSARQ